MGVTGEERVSYEITRAQFEDTEPRIPLVGTYTVRNTGNVEWKPDRISVEAYEISDPDNTATFEVASDDIPLVKPGKVLDAKLSLGHKLTEGRYRAKVRFYYKEAMIQELETPPFSVFQVGTLDQAGELLEVTTNKTSYNVGEQVVLRGLFKNTGDVTVEGQLETQVYKNGEFVNLEVSRTLNIDRRQETTFEQFIKMNEPGEYTLEVAATYGTRKTPAQKITITVQSSALGAVGNMYITIALLSLFVVGVIIFLILFARRRKDGNGQSTIGAVPVVRPTLAEIPVTTPVVPAPEEMPTSAPAAVETPMPIVLPAQPVPQVAMTEVAVTTPQEVVVAVPQEVVVVPTSDVVVAPVATPEVPVPTVVPEVVASLATTPVVVMPAQAEIPAAPTVSVNETETSSTNIPA